jgi:uncharacterized protein (TIGR02996 family)
MEEEAFLRKIIDTPGDDTPRLIYSDWLEERNDPRGFFLRAEVEWAKPWKYDQRPNDSTKLRSVSKGLDPLWVARVSRPPLGVCWEQVSVNASGTSLSLSELWDLEQRLGVSFGMPLIAMLLNRNGGVPKNCIYASPRSGDRHGIRCFLHATAESIPHNLSPRSPDSSMESFWTFTTSELNEIDSLGRDRAFLPFAMDTEIGSFALGVSPKRIGKVYRFATGSLGTLKSPKLVDASLPEFLANVVKFVRPVYTDI